jgi:serine/threonine-protein kinase RsbW
MDRFRIEMPCQLVYRDAAGALIAAICERLEQSGGDDGLRDQVVSAFNEAFNNLALHSGRASEVQIDLEVGERELAIEIRDRGEAFDYEDIPLPDLDELPESGLGIFIMRSFMSAVDYRPGQGGSENVLRMVRQLRAGSD